MPVKHSWPQISKEVGWNEIEVEYPKMELVDRMCGAAMIGHRKAIVSLLLWYRFLKSTTSDEQQKMLRKIMGHLFHAKRMFCE